MVVRNPDSTERRLYFEVYPATDSVTDLRHMVARRLRTNPGSIKLVFQGDVMEDGYLLRSYRVQKHPGVPVFAIHTPSYAASTSVGGVPRGRYRPQPRGYGNAMHRLHGKKTTMGR